MTAAAPVRVGIFCEAGCKFKYPHPLDLAELLARRGADVTVFGPPDAEVPDWNRGRGFRYEGLGGAGNLSFLRGAMARLPALDRVVACTAPTLPLALYAHSVLGRRAVYYPMELVIAGRPKAGFYSRTQGLLRHVDLPVFTTGAHRSRLLGRALGLPRTPGFVENTALRHTAAVPVEDRPTLRERVVADLGREPTLLLALNAGLNEVNCFDMLLDADISVDSGIIVALFGPLDEPWRIRLAKAQERSGNYLYYGEVPGSRYDVVRLLQGADLGMAVKRNMKGTCINDRYYTPTKLYDYVAAGVPVLCGDQRSLAFVPRWGIGVACAEPSPDRLHRVLRELAAEGGQARINQMKKNVQRLFDERLNYETSAEPLVRAVLDDDVVTAVPQAAE